jgi:hypothetical protein
MAQFDNREEKFERKTRSTTVPENDSKHVSSFEDVTDEESCRQ